jgi:glutathione S-transferase
MVELYIDYLSQPSRTVLAFCLLNNIPHTIKLTSIMSGDTRSPEFVALNPNKVVPCIRDGDFVLYESNAILTYLADTYCPDSHWYPKDPAKRAKVDEMLHWHHWNVRYGCGTYTYRTVVKPRLSGRPLPDSLRAELEFIQDKALSFLNKRAEGGWLLGTAEPTLADLVVVAELTSLKIVDFDYDRYPDLKRWMGRMLSLPGVQAAHAEFFSQVGAPKL